MRFLPWQGWRVVDRCSCWRVVCFGEDVVQSRLDDWIAIGLYLLQNKQCAGGCSGQQFSILAGAGAAFRLSALEATCIGALGPVLCRRREFVCSLQVSHWLAFLGAVLALSPSFDAAPVFHQYSSPAFLSISLRFVDRQ